MNTSSGECTMRTAVIIGIFVCFLIMYIVYKIATHDREKGIIEKANAYLHRHNKTAKDIAFKVDILPGHLHNILNGTSKPTPEELVKIESAYLSDILNEIYLTIEKEKEKKKHV